MLKMLNMGIPYLKETIFTLRRGPSLHGLSDKALDDTQQIKEPK